MKPQRTILIADRNPHVREFLKRELSVADCNVRLAESGRDVLNSVCRDMGIRVVIMDPDFPDMDQNILLEKLRTRLPLVPVILHTCLSDCESMNLKERYSVIAVIEKEGGSVEKLITTVSDVLNKNDRNASQ